MTTIRKIVTSKIDGSDANSNDINEIRPFGETAFYLDTSSNPSNLTLMMFDGVRTNQRSKVLSPGVLFGSNADSADGAGLDTIKLIPDARLHYNFGDYGNDQYLVIDPTAPNHIHIRAGGTIDNSNAELYLGGELTHVKVSDGADNVVIRTSTLGEGITERNWIFGSDGSLSLPNGLTVLGGAPLLVAETGNDLGIETSRLAFVSAECAPRGAGDNFVADITDNDDITVVREGWNVVIDGTLYIVTTIMNGIGEFDIFATGANFVPGTTYTFINPTPVTSNWVFGLDGALTTPGLGTISHRNNDLKVEVTGTDVIVLRTAGGDLLLNANGSLETPGILILPNDNRITTGGDLNSNSINFSLPDPITGSQRFDFAFDASYGFPVLRFPDDSLQTTAWTGGRVRDAVPAHSYGAAGDKDGDLAFSNGYIYYCTQDFAAESYSTTIVITYTGFYPDIVKGSIPQPQAGWAFVHNGTTYTLASNAVENNPGEWNCELTTSISVTAGDTVTVGPVSSANIWKRVAWSGDTW